MEALEIEPREDEEGGMRMAGHHIRANVRCDYIQKETSWLKRFEMAGFLRQEENHAKRKQLIVREDEQWTMNPISFVGNAPSPSHSSIHY